MTAHRTADLRRQNLVRVLSSILSKGPSSRAELAAELGLSRAALTAIVGDLLELDLLREGGSVASRGRPFTLLEASPDRYASLGIDVRIDRVELMALGLDGTELARAACSVPPEPTPLELEQAMGDLLVEIRAEIHHELIGFGFAMPARRADLGMSHPIWGWRDVPVQNSFRQLAAGRPYAVLDLAEAACLANSRQPQLRDASRAVHLQIGAGATMARAIDGRINLDLPARWGEPGHVPLGLEDRPCSCGRTGCAHAFVSIDTLASAAPHVTVPSGPNRITRLATAIAAAAAAGDRRAAEGISHVAVAVSRLVVILVELDGLDAVTLGGYPLFLGPDFLDLVDRLVSERLRAPSPIRRTTLRDDAVLTGASLIARDAGLADPAALRA
ncbi:ROK family transcriptional regulator [Tessaracoccus defluvii]|uniref:ROK family protein n=1 Tax=Tessaracoccus defluvii TaxID=1285901 RepID=A0A7H0H9W7_9ACTN|nr:ROK family protein [Tessaracoccus defluvii]QNP57333.1 ROK family protein [Tessaracoccus defluvii]